MRQFGGTIFTANESDGNVCAFAWRTRREPSGLTLSLFFSPMPEFICVSDHRAYLFMEKSESRDYLFIRGGRTAEGQNYTCACCRIHALLRLRVRAAQFELSLLFPREHGPPTFPLFFFTRQSRTTRRFGIQFSFGQNNKRGSAP